MSGICFGRQIYEWIAENGYPVDGDSLVMQFAYQNWLLINSSLPVRLPNIECIVCPANTSYSFQAVILL